MTTFMQGLASFIMRGRLQAVLVIVSTALLPLLNLISGAALALVTLRRGYQEGIVILLLSASVALVLFTALAGSPIPVIGLLALFWLPMWLLAAALRYTVSLGVTLQFALLLAVLTLLGYSLYLGDTVAWGRLVLQQLLVPLLQGTGLGNTATGTDPIIDYLAPVTLGLIFANGLASLLLGLLLGRWWQSLLYNPGGFRQEFHELRMGRQTAAVAAGVLALAMITNSLLLMNMALLLVAIYMLQGLAVIHGITGKAGLTRGWLIGLYVLLFLVLPQMATLLCMLGIIDAWADFRARIKPVAK